MEKVGVQRIRISEIFESVQGEGPRSGIPTTFLRTAGCNFRCEGWGVKTTLPDGTEVTGCDSPHSVFPQIFNLPGNSQFLTVDELVAKIPEFPVNICLTGGEPLLQKGTLEPVVEELTEKGHLVEVFTNGSRLARDQNTIWASEQVTYVMDYKLNSSGEGGKFDRENFNRLSEFDMVKFVIGTREDFDEAVEVIRSIEAPEFWWSMGVVFQKLDPRELIGWILELKLPNLQLNLQTQSLMGMDESERTQYGKIV